MRAVLLLLFFVLPEFSITSSVDDVQDLEPDQGLVCSMASSFDDAVGEILAAQNPGVMADSINGRTNLNYKKMM
jgi:hypothetical protein